MRWSVKKAVFHVTILCLCIVKQFQIPASLAAEKVEEEPYYVGMEKCNECHPEYVKTYSEWKYSRNFRILELREMEDDPRCLPCHTTGYGKPGGFVSAEKTPHMKNVQCETCHGPASSHLKASTVEEHQMTLVIPVNICTTCHRQHKHMGY